MKMDIQTPTARIFMAQWEARFGNCPELGATVLAEFAEDTDPDLWRPLLDFASSSGFSQQKKPLLAELTRARGAVIRERAAAKRAAAASSSLPAPGSATKIEVDIILAAAELGGPRFSAWLFALDSDGSLAAEPNSWPLSVLKKAPRGSLEVIADAHRINDSWAKWATSEIEAGQPLEALAGQIKEKAPAAASDEEPEKQPRCSALVAALRAKAKPPSRRRRTIDPVREAQQ